MSVSKEIKTGIFHTAIFKYASYFVTLLVSTILARLLTPEEYGIVAVINVFVLFFLMLSAFGLGEAIVQNLGLTEKDISSLFIISVFLSFLFSFGFFLSAGFVADFYSNKEYVKITHLLSLSLFFLTANTVPSHLLRKSQKFKIIGTINLSLGILGGISAIVMALNGFSYYALVYKSIIESFLELVLCLRFTKIKLYKELSFTAFRRVFNYSLFQLLYNFLAYISRSTDIIIIGKFLGSASLGYYERAVRLFSTVTSLSQVIQPVLHPVLSNHQNDLELLYSVLKKVTKIISLLGIPLSIFLYFSSGEIIILLYGKQWLKTIPVFQFMGLMVWIYLLLTSNVSFFQVLGKTNILFLYGILYFLLLVTATVMGVFIEKSFIKVAFYILISNTILLSISYYLLITKLFKKRIFDFMQIFKSGFIIGLIAILINITIDLIFQGVSIYMLLAIKIFFNGISFYTMSRILNEYREIISLIKKN